MHYCSEQPKNKRTSTAHGRNTFEPPFDASPPRSPVHQKSLFGKMHLFATTQGEVTEFLQAVCAARILGCRSCLSARPSARLSDLLSAPIKLSSGCLKCNWIAAIGRPRLSITSDSLSLCLHLYPLLKCIDSAIDSFFVPSIVSAACVSAHSVPWLSIGSIDSSSSL